MIYTTEKIAKIPFRYLPEDFAVDNWESVKAIFDSICENVPQTKDELLDSLYRYSEISKALSDELSWKYVHMTVHADDESYAKAYNDFYANIYAQTEPLRFKFKELYYQSPAKAELDPSAFDHLNQIISNEIELYREKNIALRIQESELANKYGAVIGSLTAEFDGEERTISQLSVFLKDPNRGKREAAWHKIFELYNSKKAYLDSLFDELKEIRVQIALNAGYPNYRDYMHAEMGRFSYSPADLYNFHQAVENVVIPFVRELDEHRRQVLGLEALRPWDVSVDLDGRVLKPFKTTTEFIDKCVKVLGKVNPEYGKQLEMMANTGLLDLENRKGKAPGGYNTGINALGSSFIFMNHVKQHNDVVTLLHEAGHAMHSQAAAPIPIAPYLDTPSEVAELASMTMELLTMDYWDEFYKKPEDLKKAKRDQLEGALSFLPWCMIVDAFQHWAYLNPEHTVAERDQAYLDIHKRFSTIIDWSDLEHLRKLGWMKQLHIFEVPFYYIEYGMAQLGALSIFMNYRKDKAKALQQYQAFLDLGYSAPVSEIYEAAGIKFDFTESRIRELVDFVKSELQALDK